MVRSWASRQYITRRCLAASIVNSSAPGWPGRTGCRRRRAERSPARRNLPASAGVALPRAPSRIPRRRPRSADPLAGHRGRQHAGSHLDVPTIDWRFAAPPRDLPASTRPTPSPPSWPRSPIHASESSAQPWPCSIAHRASRRSRSPVTLRHRRWLSISAGLMQRPRNRRPRPSWSAMAAT